MNKSRIIVTLLALLGFSTSCCSSRKASRKDNSKEMPPETIERTLPEIRLMYGPPRNAFIEAERIETDSTAGNSQGDGNQSRKDDNSGKP